MQEEKKSAVPFILASLLSVAVLSAVLAVAGFLAMIPYAVFASAILATPFVSVLLFALFLNNAGMSVPVCRAVTGFVSALGAYLFLCFMMGAVSGVYGAYPLEMDEMREVEFSVYIENLPVIFANALLYFIKPGQLWQDIMARGDAVWGLAAAGALFAQIGLPQVFIRARVTEPEPAEQKPKPAQTPAQKRK
ncbi:MAG: hypothetical protein LBR76_01795 [Oscillospiraceae bacterium]|nr:hypothetical protein [Oscillospiraceae bacterium]